MTLKEAVELQKEPLLQSLAESIRIRSVQEPPADGAPYGPNVRKCLDHALAVSKGLGFRTTDLDHQMGWCEFGEDDEMIAVLGHLDVVPEGEGWTFDPFGGEIRDGKKISYDITPEQFGLKTYDQSEIIGGTPEENARITKDILRGKEQGAKRDIVLMNAGLGIYLGIDGITMEEGVHKAKEVIDSGAAYRKMEEFVKATQE